MGDPFGAPAPGPNQAADATIRRNQWGQYLLPHPETGEEQAWPRVTTIAKTLADQFALTQWKMRMVARGVGMRPDLGMLAAAADPDSSEGKSALHNVTETAMEVAGSSKGRNLGTALHNFTEQYDRGQTPRVPEPYDRDVSEYVRTLRMFGLQAHPNLIERVVVCPELGAAGTLDRIMLCSDGVWRIVDLKTAQEVQYSGIEIAVQLAIYAHSTYAWIPETNSYEALPALDQGMALVIHLPSGQARCEVNAVNVAEGWNLAQLSIDVRHARSNAKKLIVPLGPPTANVPPVHEVLTAPPAIGPMPGHGDKTDYQVGDTVTVAGIEFVKHAELPDIESQDAIPTKAIVVPRPDEDRDALMARLHEEDAAAHEQRIGGLILQGIKQAATRAELHRLHEVHLARWQSERWQAEFNAAADKRWHELTG